MHCVLQEKNQEWLESWWHFWDRAVGEGDVGDDVLVTFLVIGTQYPSPSLEEERLTLAQGFNPWLGASKAGTRWQRGLGEEKVLNPSQRSREKGGSKEGEGPYPCRFCLWWLTPKNTFSYSTQRMTIVLMTIVSLSTHENLGDSIDLNCNRWDGPCTLLKAECCLTIVLLLSLLSRSLHTL